MDPVSKTKKKKEALSLQELGKELAALSSEQLKRMALPTDLLNAITLVRTIKKHGGRLRQMQYIGSLMRKQDPAPIQEALKRMNQGAR